LEKRSEEFHEQPDQDHHEGYEDGEDENAAERLNVIIGHG
jgi:hypothetical protein